MPHHAMRHPRVLSALEIVRDPSGPSHRSAIRSIALFTVTRCRNDGPRFKMDHRAFDRDANRSDILDGIAARIPSDATLIAKAPPVDAHALRQAQNGNPLPPSDLQLIQRLRGDLDILPLQCRSSALDETAATLPTPDADADADALVAAAAGAHPAAFDYLGRARISVAIEPAAARPPYFLYLPFQNVHAPYTTLPRFRAAFDNDTALTDDEKTMFGYISELDAAVVVGGDLEELAQFSPEGLIDGTCVSAPPSIALSEDRQAWTATVIADALDGSGRYEATITSLRLLTVSVVEAPLLQ